jgi:hypothetical protein
MTSTWSEVTEQNGIYYLMPSLQNSFPLFNNSVTTLKWMLAVIKPLIYRLKFETSGPILAMTSF